MRFGLVSNSRDAVVGMRLAGVIGKLVRTRDEALIALDSIVKDEDIGIVLINESLANEISDVLYKIKETATKPLLAVIPDGRSSGRDTNSIMEHIRDAIGLKI